MKEDLIEKIEIPQGVEVSLDSYLKIKGPKGELKRIFPVEIKIENNQIILLAKKATKREKKLIKTSKSHIKNMIKGVLEEYEYLLQICSAHFPMTASIKGNFFMIKNFLGETKERKARIMEGSRIQINGEIVKVTAVDKEVAGQTAANIEKATRIKDRDKTRFQDGIWIIKKADKEM